MRGDGLEGHVTETYRLIFPLLLAFDGNGPPAQDCDSMRVHSGNGLAVRPAGRDLVPLMTDLEVLT